MKKVELLAPAGNFDGLKGAIKAGADAVYLGGRLFGARAYADNFSEEEICDAIHMAHVFGRKIYLTVNTLVKEKELDQLYDFLLPFYIQGLDGVIVQDLGVLKYIREHFPGLELHASTQMSLSGSRGTEVLKEAGVSRIVPARELSLSEIKAIHESTGIEIEAFIHGAMCYCYSGQCLLSSMLGGRSGNRGRCAQPCRLPYSIDGGKECYPLSMRDMCTLDLIPELIEAGIASFKIEGRMKKPVYTAGVTSIYRKYIDLYYQDKDNYQVTSKDRERLNSIYIRSKTGEGYYHKHNGKEMLTIESPAYSGTEEGLLNEIEKDLITGNPQIPVEADIYLEPGHKAILKLQASGCCISCEGDVVQAALKQPLSKEKVEEQIQKSGNTLLNITGVRIKMNGDVFMPVRALNELRRSAVILMEEELIRKNGLSHEERKIQTEVCSRKAANVCALQGIKATETVDDTGNTKREPINKRILSDTEEGLHVSVTTLAQLESALTRAVSRIYLDYSMMEQINEDKLRRVKDEKGLSYYLATPYIVREKDISHLKQLADKLRMGLYDGVLIRNLESYGFLKEEAVPGNFVLDSNMYLWNRESCSYWIDKVQEFYLPIEQNGGEWRELMQKADLNKLSPSAVVYGRLPMMISSGCVRKTSGKCEKKSGMSVLKDRYEKEFPVYADCLCCYNVIYNSVPLSLHGLFKKQHRNIDHFRLDFTVEDSKTTEKIIDYFGRILMEYKEPFYQEFTTGHYKRGVE